MSADRLVAMEIFVRVVDAGSFSAAASQLGVGQPAVSKAVAQLEERLGVRLLLRSTRRLNLTDAGKTFYENAKRAIGSAWKALESAEKYMFKLKMEHVVFDEMTARAERLRLELEALGRK